PLPQNRGLTQPPPAQHRDARPLFRALSCIRLAHTITGQAMVTDSFGPRGFARGGSWGQGQEHRRAPQQLTEEVQGRTPLRPAGPPLRHQDRLRPRPYPGPVAAPDLAQDDAEANRQLGPPVDGVQARLTQEREQVVAMGPQVLGQALVGRVHLGGEDQVGQLVLQPTAGHGQAVLADLPGRVTVTQIQAGPKQLSDTTRKAHGSPRRCRRHVVGTPQQVIEALLMQGLLELVVRGPAVVNHGAGVVASQDVLGHGTAAGRVDDVSGGLRPDQRVQPGWVSAHPPAGLIGYDPVGVAHGLADRLVGRLAAGGGPQDGVDAAAASERNPKQALQAARNLAVGQATLLVEFDDSGLGIGPQLRGSGTQGVGRLQGMASLNATLALTTPADVDVELPVDGLARDLELELLSDVGFVKQAAAVRADFGQRRLMHLVDLFGGRWLAVGLGAIVLARLAAGLAGVGLGRVLGEGPGLALTGAEGRVKLPTEPLVLGLQVVDPSLQGLAVGTPDRFHAGIIRSSQTCSCGGGGRGSVQLEPGALIKYPYC